MIKHFRLYEHSAWYNIGCDCCDNQDYTYYNFEDESIAKQSGSVSDINDIPIEIYDYLGYHIPEHLDDYEEVNTYVGAMLEALGVTWEIVEESE